jgi:hypothetical protein
MNGKRVVLAGLAAFVVTMAIGFAANAAFIGNLYIEHAVAAARPMADRRAMLPYVLVATVLSHIAFAYVYAWGYAARSGVAEGIKLGLAVGVMGMAGNIFQWMFYPIGGAIPAVIIPWEFVNFAIAGAVIAMVYKPTQAGKREVSAAASV